MVPKGITGNFKRLIVCCDGTWMSSDQAKSSKENPTNVTRFCRAIENAEVLSDGSEIQQVVYYQKGIGTGDMGALQKVIAGEAQLSVTITWVSMLIMFKVGLGLVLIRMSARLITFSQTTIKTAMSSISLGSVEEPTPFEPFRVLSAISAY